MKLADEGHMRLAHIDHGDGGHIPQGAPTWSGNKSAVDGVIGAAMPRSFEEVLLPHLDAAFNYARWLTKNDADAEDVVQTVIHGSANELAAVRCLRANRPPDPR